VDLGDSNSQEQGSPPITITITITITTTLVSQPFKHHIGLENELNV
jgi:hypothetical protein